MYIRRYTRNNYYYLFSIKGSGTVPYRTVYCTIVLPGMGKHDRVKFFVKHKIISLF